MALLCLTNLRCTGLQFRGVSPIWLISNCLVKTCNVEEIVSKVIIIACDHLLVSKMPKTRRKSEENRLFQKTRIQTILDKSPWDSTAIFIFFCYFSVPSLNSAAFSKFSCSSPSPHPIQSWNIVFGVRGGVGPVWIGKRPRNAKVFQDFCSWL